MTTHVMTFLREDVVIVETKNPGRGNVGVPSTETRKNARIVIFISMKSRNTRVNRHF